VLTRRVACGPIGIDLGASSVKLLQFSDEGGQPSIAGAAYCEIPQTIEDADERQAFIKQAVADACRRDAFKGRRAVASLGLSDFQMKSIRLPHMPPDELAAAVEFEAKDRFGLEGQDAQIQFINAGEVRHGNELKDEIIVFAVPQAVVQQRLELLESCGLEPISVDAAPCAVARSFVRFLRRAEDAQAVNVFVDVGRSGTCIIITRGAELMFLKVIDVGGEQLNQAVAKALNITKAQAAELRVRIMRGSTGRRADDRAEVTADVSAAVADAVRPLVDRLARDLQLCLRYFAVTFRGQRPDSLTFVGGEANEPLLSKIVTETVDIPCIVGHPLRGVGRTEMLGGRDRRTIQPAWTVACGLALRGSAWVGGQKHGSAWGGRRSLQAAAMRKQ